jgi:hypothetical protein
MSTTQALVVPPGYSPLEIKIYRVSFAVAVVYNLIWGTAVILFPTLPFKLIDMPVPDSTGILFWQCIGMFVLVYAAGYYYLAVDPLRYAPFALVAVLGKIFGPIGWLYAYLSGQVPAITGLTIVTNDLLWWPIWFVFVYKTLISPKTRVTQHRLVP